MGINEIIMYIMMFFMLIAAVDRILSQFGGSARFLGKFGKSIEGSGGQFEEGFMAMGALGLAMVGMTALAPVLAKLLGPVIIPLYEMLGANPSMFAGTLLACDMGGFFLAKGLAGGDVAAWLYSGLILGAMMGPTIVFSIPVALGIIEPSEPPLPGAGRAGGDCYHSHWLYRRWFSGDVLRRGDQRATGGVYLRADPDEHDPGDHRRGAGRAGAEIYPGENDQRFPDLR
ncbi:ethanolamine transporter [Citrobacter koseri]|uniref:Ethanolamine transporter n=1 Tax=Citrobacter koseri TaxID=545 RepID=A0A3S4ICV2_CITKO|nr:ethanolamine transporter [Citrobacter koseri]